MKRPREQTAKAGGGQKSRVTIKDVARAARVSPMTVSNVVNGKFRFVSEATRSLVENEIARLGYRVHKHGRNLRSAHHNSVGMVIVDESPSFLADPFTATMVAGLSNILSQAKYALSVQGIRPSAFTEAGFFRRFEVDGFCVVLSGSAAAREEMIAALSTLRQPTILFQEPISTFLDDFCVIRQDDFGGGALIARHLAEAGVKRVVMIQPAQQWPAIANREAGLRTGAKAFAIEVVRAASEGFEDVQTALKAYLSAHPLPDALFGANDRIALAAMGFLQGRGIAVPAKVRVMGFNAFEPRRYVLPLLTSVRSPAYDLGVRAGETMLLRLESGAFPIREIVLPISLEMGDSG